MLVLCANLEGWEGRVAEGGFRREDHRYAYGQFMLIYGRGHHNIVK